MTKRTLVLVGSGIVGIGLLIGFSWGHLGILKASHTLPSLSMLQGKDNLIPVAIIGSGPAGLSAALYAARFANDTVIFAGPKPGGLLTETSYVENWPGITRALGPDIMQGLESQAKGYGAQLTHESITSVDFTQWPYVLTTDEGTQVHALTLIIATGAVPKKLGIPGEEEYWSKGVSSCAVCDAPLFHNKTVCVIGGGDSAAEEALQLAKHAQKVIVLVRKDKMRATAAMQEHLAAVPNISVMYNVKPLEILGNTEAVTGIKVQDSVTNEARVIETEGVFLAIGHEPKSSLVRDKVAVDAQGYIQVQQRTQQTSVLGVYAAGDVEDHRYRQAGYAAGHGIAAAIDANQFLQDIGFNQEVAQQYKAYLYEPIAGKPSLVHTVQTVAELKHELATSAVPVLVDCYTDYCASCMHMMPAVESIAHKFASKIKVCKVNIERSQELGEYLGVRKVPAFVVYKKGQVAAQKNVVMSKQEMVAWMQEVLAV